MVNLHRLLLVALLLIAGQATLTIHCIRNAASDTACSHSYSSLRGGKDLYITVTGHDSTNPSNNKIELYNAERTVPCTVQAEGLLENSLSCKIGDSGSLEDTGALSVRVTKINSNGVNEVAEYSAKSVYMRVSSTPTLSEIFSTAGFYKEGQLMYLYGNHRISDFGDGELDMGDIDEVSLTGTTSSASTYNLNEGSGDNSLAQVCSLLNIDQDLSNYIKCAPSRHTAGHYFVLLSMTGLGYSEHARSIKRSTFVDKHYHEYTVLPVINTAFLSVQSQSNAVASSSYSTNGNTIYLLGYGFDGVTAADNVLKIDNTACHYRTDNEGTILGTGFSQTHLACDLDAHITGDHTRLDYSGSGTQVKGYHWGAGLEYTRYSYSGSISDFVTKARAGTLASSTIVEDTIRADVKAGNTFGTYYGAYYRGYFVAETTGTHIFRAWSDDRVRIYIANETGTAEIPSDAAPVVESSKVQSFNDFYIIDDMGAQGSVDLVAGKSYYIEIFHYQASGSGWLKTQVEVPKPTNAPSDLFTSQVNKIQITADHKQEIDRFVMSKSEAGKTIEITYLASGGDSDDRVTRTVEYDCSASNLRSHMHQFSFYSSWYGTTMTKTYVDASGNTVATEAECHEIHYDFTMYRLRSDANQALLWSIIDATNFTLTRKAVQEHSPIISGTWTLEYLDGNSQVVAEKAFTYGQDEGTVKSWIDTQINTGRTGTDKYSINVYRQTSWGVQYDCAWAISWAGVDSAVQQFRLKSENQLAGGNSGTPNITWTEVRSFSTNVIFQPIDYHHLRRAGDKPGYDLTVNGLPAVCTLADCGYKFEELGEIDSFSINEGTSTLTFALTDSQSRGFTGSDVNEVTVDGQPCTMTSTADLTNLQCTLSNTNGVTGQPILIAPDATPKVLVTGIGYLPLKAGVAAHAVTFSATSATPASGLNSGGYEVTIAGTGFPLTTSQVEVTVCSKTATVTSVNNRQIKFTMPECAATGSQIITVSNPGASLSDNSQSITLNPSAGVVPEVTSLSVTTANPGVKTALTITGVRFGTDKSLVSINLQNKNASAKSYGLKVLSVTDTQIKAFLPGSDGEGSFDVVVTVSGVGTSISTGTGDDFDYEFKISAISPATGSSNGGTLVTLTGVNFINDLQQTHVYIGDQLNQFCLIETGTITSTQLQCRTPPKHRLEATGVDLAVRAATRLVIDSVGTVNFQYSAEASSPSLTGVASASASAADNVTAIDVGAEELTLTGTNFGASCSAVVLTNLLDGTSYSLTPSSCSDTEAKVTITAEVKSANYTIRVRNSNTVGDSNMWMINVKVDLGTVTKGASRAGAILKLANPNGWPTSQAELSTINYNVTLKMNGIAYEPMFDTYDPANGVIKVKIPASSADSNWEFKVTSFINSVSEVVGLTSASTETVSVKNPAVLTYGSNSLTLTQTMSTSTYPITAIKLVSTVDSTYSVDATNVATASDETTFDVILPAGAYNVVASSELNTYSCSDVVQVDLQQSQLTITNKQVSYKGGQVVINSNNAGQISSASYIKIEDKVGKLKTLSGTTATYEVPALVTTTTQTQFGLVDPVSLIDLSPFTLVSDTDGSSSNKANAFDGDYTTYYNSGNAACTVGVDFGATMKASIGRVRFFPQVSWQLVIDHLLDAKFQGSNDNTNWNDLTQVAQDVRSGWNTHMVSDSTPYRYVRFSHTEDSMCNLAEIELWGIVYQDVTIANIVEHQATVNFYDGYNDAISFASAVSYRQDKTPIVSTISPRYGEVLTEEVITITGQNLNTADFTDTSVMIDGLACTMLTAVDANSFTCKTAQRPTIPSAGNSFSVSINGNDAVLNDQFMYVLKWSNPDTWGTDLPPIDGDLISVPKGMALMIDESTPKLAGIAVENGSLLFEDKGAGSAEIQVQAGFITLIGGKFVAGTETHPFQGKLTFIMEGDYYGAQQPNFGNKGIGCMDCKLSMHGAVRTKTWTLLASTITAGTNNLVLLEDVDWQVGEEIVVASTSFNHYDAEKRTIATRTDARTFTVSEAFSNEHISDASPTNYISGHSLQIRAEVGLLTRNIKMRGADGSESARYGSHLIVMGRGANGAEGQVAFSEFTHCGQPKIRGRYCIHFHMLGEAPSSYAKSNAVHDSFARLTTVHGVHYVTVDNNVGYKISGHNIFVEDGIETNNIIINNLIVSSRAATNMMQTDTSVASIWVTHPTNDVYNNHAAGSDFYGIWYEIKKHPDGPSATTGVCPIGNPLGKVENNTAHSNTRFGLRIDEMHATRYPCRDVRDDSNTADPWASNPSISNTFKDFTIWKNMEDGVIAEETGNVHFVNFVVAESWKAGFQFLENNYTKEMTTITNSAIIGESHHAEAGNNNYTNSSAIWTGKNGAIYVENVLIKNFGITNMSSGAIKTCTECDNPLKYSNRGTELYLKDITFDNVTGNYLHMVGSGIKRDVIYDLTGSLVSAFNAASGSLSAGSKATITHNWPHLTAGGKCHPPSSPDDWDNAIMCESDVEIRRVQFTNMQKHQNFKVMKLRTSLIDTLTSSVPMADANVSFSEVYHRLDGTSKDSKDKGYGWSLPFAIGSIYNVWWGSGVDWTHMAIESHMNSTDEGIIFRFNNTQQREKYKVAPRRGSRTTYSYANETRVLENNGVIPLSTATCKNGQWNNVFDQVDLTKEQQLVVCQSGTRDTMFEYTEVDGVMCEAACPSAEGIKRDSWIRSWGADTNLHAGTDAVWPTDSDNVFTISNTAETVAEYNADTTNTNKITTMKPTAGDDVFIHPSHTFVLDEDTPELNTLIIDGRLVIPIDRNLTIKAKFIWVRAGAIYFYDGSDINTEATLPSDKTFTIELLGQKGDTTHMVGGDLSGAKMMVVTGYVNLKGSTPVTTKSHLSANANAGTNTITVDSRTGWQVGDQLVISPSYKDRTEHEIVTIASLSGNDVTLVENLAHNHYGSTNTTSVVSGISSIPSLDTRARVAHMTRNVRITAGANVDWGFSFVVYRYTAGWDTDNDGSSDKFTERRGDVELNGVQFINGGQLDSTRSALVFQDTQQEASSTVKKSTFVNCKAFCTYIDKAEGITMENNNFYNAWVYGVEVSEDTVFSANQKIYFRNNLIIGVTQRPTVPAGQELISCFSMYKDVSGASVEVTDNECYGSVHGWSLPYTNCDALEDHKLMNNIAGSCEIGFALNKNGHTNMCLGFSYAKGFYNNIGLICGAPSISSINFTKLLFAENGRSVTLKLGASEGPEQNDHNAYFSDSHVAAIARPLCTDCYSTVSNTYCSGAQGVRAFSASANGETMPKKFGSVLDVICKQEVFSAKAYLNGVTFDNFRQSYTDLPGCGSNFIFKVHGGASDQTAGHYLTNSPCTNCDSESYLFAQAPLQQNFGWFGGCGELLCTGRVNYMIQDMDGAFLGQRGAVMPNHVLNPIASSETNCTASSAMQASVCLRGDLRTLEYQNEGLDRQTRIMWPVYLKYEQDDGSYSYESSTNGWREWEWLGIEPRNERFGRFVTNIVANKTYNMTFEAAPPDPLEIQLQRSVEAGDVNTHVVIKLHYPFPNMIQVKNDVTKVVVDPILKRTGRFKRDLDLTKCGDNQYDYQAYTIKFVVTEEANCRLHIYLQEMIQLTASFAITEDEFFASDGPMTNFINNLAALLNIVDTSRIKIVGVVTGSITVNAAILPASTDSNSTSNSSNATNASASSEPSLAAIADTLVSSTADGSLSSTLGAAVGGTTLGVATTTLSTPDYTSTTTTEESSTNVALIAGVSIAGIAIVFLATIFACYMFRRRAKIQGDLQSDDTEEEKDKDKVPSFMSFQGSHEAPEGVQSNFKIKERQVHVEDIEHFE